MLKIYYDKDTWVLVNYSVDGFYMWFLFKIDALPQDVVFLLEIVAIFFNNLSPDVWEFLIPKGFQISQILPIDTNNQENQRTILVITIDV